MEMCQMKITASFPLRIGRFAANPNKMPTCSSRVAAMTTNSNSLTEKLESESRNRMFILGMGFVGQFFAQTLKKEGWVVTGTCTSIAKKKQLEEKGFDVCVFDANEPEWSNLNAMKCYTHLLISIPPVANIGDPMLQHGELIRSKLMDANLQWLCYLSSTSVYGHCGGAWVDEDYPTSPASELANLRLVAEAGWLNLGHFLGLSTQVFRLGGIYGPGRSAVDTIMKQEPWSEGQKMRTSKQYTSRVHVEDICQALKCSISMPSPRRIYNIVDDDPAPREEVFVYAEDLIQKKWPGRIKSSTDSACTVSSSKKCSSGEEKRVSNSRMKSELGVRLLHPSYKSGLLNVIDQMENPLQHNSS